MQTRYLVTTVFTKEQFEELKEAAETLTDGNMSEVTRRFVVATLDDYRKLRQSGILRIVLVCRAFFTRRHRGRSTRALGT